MFFLTFVVFISLLSGSLSVFGPDFYLTTDSDFDSNCKCLGNTEEDLQNAIKKLNNYVESVRVKEMIPSILAGISVKGKNVWIQPFGKTDIENDVKSSADSITRLASISKSLTSVLVGKLIEKGLIDLNQSVHHYLSPNIFPVHKWNGKNVDITVGQVMSHTAGLHETDYPEDFYNYYGGANVTQSLVQFKDAPLIFAPGTPGQYNYSNYGFQVLGAVVESVIKPETFEEAMNKMFKELDMNFTHCERHEELIPHRSRYYMRSDSYFIKEKLENKLEILNSMLADDMWAINKWLPAAGIVSKVSDLLRFGNFMIESHKGVNSSVHLKPSTVDKLWEPVIQTCENCYNGTGYYGHGWGSLKFDKPITCEGKCFMPPITKYYWHTGGLSGLTTILMVFPETEMVVTVLINMTPAWPLMDIALNILKTFIQ